MILISMIVVVREKRAGRLRIYINRKINHVDEVSSIRQGEC